MASWLSPRSLLRRLRFIGKDTEGVFTRIYEKRLWDSSESVSGAGSTLAATAPLRSGLPRLLESLGVRRLLDAPCGDYYWMSRVELDLDEYIGGDIVAPLIEDLNRRYGGDGRRFVHLDITTDPLPDADAFLCRDCLLHLEERQVIGVLRNALHSSCDYLLASNYPKCERNVNIRTGLARPLNLCREPFELPEPMASVADPGPHNKDKSLDVWDLRRLRANPPASLASPLTSES